MAAKVKRFWFVIPNDIQGNGQQWYGPVAVGRGFGLEPNVEPARPRNDRGRRNEGEEVVVSEDAGYGIGLSPKEQKEVMAFTTKGKAEEYAKYQATMHPQRLFGIFECGQMFETTEPTVLSKKFNDAGELVLDTKE